MNKKVIYLASGYGVLDTVYDVTYNDCYIQRDLVCDMMEVDLSNFDILLASPPCNYWSRANYRRDISVYAQSTKHLLPGILEKFIKTGKPFIVENVLNKKLMKDIINNLPFGVFYIELGRHCYFTNINFTTSDLNFSCENVQYLSRKNRQGSGGINTVFNRFLACI